MPSQFGYWLVQSPVTDGSTRKQKLQNIFYFVLTNYLLAECLDRLVHLACKSYTFFGSKFEGLTCNYLGRKVQKYRRTLVIDRCIRLKRAKILFVGTHANCICFLLSTFCHGFWGVSRQNERAQNAFFSIRPGFVNEKICINTSLFGCFWRFFRRRSRFPVGRTSLFFALNGAIVNDSFAQLLRFVAVRKVGAPCLVLAC